MKNTTKLKIILLLTVFASLTACNKFLDVKPDGKMVVPKDLNDCELLLNDYTVMNCSYPSAAEVSADDYFLPASIWQSIALLDDRNYYIWSNDVPTLSVQWMNAYKVIYNTNQVLEIVTGLNQNSVNMQQYHQVAGAAHFYRAFAFHQLLSCYALPYDKSTANNEPGIPLKLSPQLDTKTTRASIQESYDQVIADYQKAASFLGITASGKGRPAKAAAFAGLARLYLDKQDYQNAYNYADSALRINNVLLDYNTLNIYSYAPIPVFNAEVLFSATTSFSYPLMQGYARVDYDLYESYKASDLRKKIYFMNNYDLAEMSYDFKGSYDNTQSGNFVGLTTSEMYLVKAESATRLGDRNTALAAINTLRKYRYPATNFELVDIANQDDLLRFILEERRRELVFRGLRWADLKRLNQDPKTQKTLTRKLGDKLYSLPPKSFAYALLIPLDVIRESKIEQNKR